MYIIDNINIQSTHIEYKVGFALKFVTSPEMRSYGSAYFSSRIQKHRQKVI